jgi:hypothetical protein
MRTVKETSRELYSPKTYDSERKSIVQSKSLAKTAARKMEVHDGVSHLINECEGAEN